MQASEVNRELLLYAVMDRRILLLEGSRCACYNRGDSNVSFEFFTKAIPKRAAEFFNVKAHFSCCTMRLMIGPSFS